MNQQTGALSSSSYPQRDAPDPVQEELDWIDRELARPVVIDSPTVRYRRERLRYHRARLEKLEA